MKIILSLAMFTSTFQKCSAWHFIRPFSTEQPRLGILKEQFWDKGPATGIFLQLELLKREACNQLPVQFFLSMNFECLIPLFFFLYSG